MAEKEKDWVTPVAVLGGGAALALGALMIFKKPPGFDPGDVFIAKFKFDYIGDGGLYVIQVRLGYKRTSFWFDPEEGLLWHEQVELPVSDTYNFELECVIPDGAEARTYDAEGSIRTPYMTSEQRLIRVFKEKAITIREV